MPSSLAWMAERDHSVITTELAVRWATLPPATDSNWHAQRLSVVRGFAAHLHAIDPVHEVPPADLLPRRPRRAVPYLYTDAEILALMDAASVIPTPHRAATMRTLIGLLAVTGMRVGEAIRLDLADIDQVHGLLRIRDTQVRQVARGRASPQHDHGSAVLSRSPRPAGPVRADRSGAHLGRGHETRLLQRASRVQTDRDARRAATALRSVSAQSA